jgi:hypothetical protein
MKEDKHQVIVDQLKKALEIGREAKSSGAIQVVVNMSQGGIQDARMTVERRIV